ncbi:MAG: ABC transporter substrate-binding protein [Deltaproteobacteria bacterium]|nr:ABC transporter substrate-binding protein [Deltaproteobacteria bacterium]
MRGKGLALGILLFLGLALFCNSALAQDVIKVGAVQPISGRFAFAGVNINAGLEDALMMANDAGGINGKKIQYIMEDGQYQLDVAIAAFKRIMSRDSPLVMYGESTGLGKAMSPEIKDRFKILYSSTSFSSELADAAVNPYIFVPGPTYSDMFGILLKYIAKEAPGAKVAFFYSDTEFGKDPIPYARDMCKQLKLDLVAEEVAQVGAVDVTSQVLDLKRKTPDFVIFQGFVVDPVQTVIKQCRDFGMKCKFMGTFWGASKMIIENLGPLAEGYMAVNPYMYWWNEDVPMIQKIREYTQKKYPNVKDRDNSYMQGFMTGLIFVECLKMADKAGQLNGEGLVKALSSLKDFDSGGLSAPYTIKNNKFPVARVWKANVEQKIFEPVSDWMTVE